jgi:hypothetical protein
MHTDSRGLIAQQIDSWLRKQVVFEDEEHGRASKIILRHLSVDRKPQGDVATFQVKLDPGSEEIEPLVDRICDAAQKDADDMSSGVQNYAIYAYFPMDLNYFPRKVFRVAGNNEDFEPGLAPSEPPTEKGLVAQLMRHNEGIMKTMTVSQGYMTGTLQRENQRLAEMNEKFALQQVDFMILLQDTLDTAHSRRLKEKKEEADLAMRDGIVSKVDSLLPVIINRIAGKNIMPVPDPSFALMGALLENLSDEQQSALLELLEPHQRPVFAEMLSEYEKKKAESMGLKPNKISKQHLGSPNSLPPPDPKGQNLLGPNQVSTDPKDPPAPSPAQPPMFKTISDRMRENPTLLSEDPVINNMESNAKKFAARFANILKPTTKKPTGE